MSLISRTVVSASAALFTAVAGQAVYADVIAAYDFENVAATLPRINTVAASESSASVAAGSFTNSTDTNDQFTGVRSGGGFPSQNYAVGNPGTFQVSNPDTDTPATPNVRNDARYVSFAVDPSAPLNLESLTFDARSVFVPGENSGAPDDAFVDVLIGQFAGDDTSLATLLFSGSVDLVDRDLTSYLVDLTGVSASDPFEVRIYHYGEEQSSGTGGSVRYDNVVLNGTVVPEPASLALIGLGSALMLRRSRKAG